MTDEPTPEPLDVRTWPRAEHFAHYRTRVPCTYSMTVEVDVTALTTALRSAGRKTYPAQVWALATVVNRHPAFRTTVVDDGPAVWPSLDPLFTVLNPERETFAGVHAPYDADFGRFHDQVSDLLDEHRSATAMFPQGSPPPNVFDVSSLPWTAFTSFSLHVDGGSAHLLPIFTLGRHVEREERTLLPLAVQVHHAATDGLHTGRFVQDLGALVADPIWVAG